MGAAVCHRTGCDTCMAFDWIFESRICYDCLEEFRGKLTCSQVDLSDEEAVERYFILFMATTKRDSKFPNRSELVSQLIDRIKTNTDGT